jgi:molecular chaperone GrpE (heat shock protein)
MNPNPSYLARLCAALLGRETTAAPASPLSAPLKSALELDLRERDERIAAMQREYAQLLQEKERAATEAGGEQMERLFKKLCGPLATLSTLAHAARADQPVEAREIADLVVSVEKALHAFGLEPIGEPGAEMPFEVALHQRMSGGAPHGGEHVRVRLPGFRLGQKVLQKAMVTGKREAE